MEQLTAVPLAEHKQLYEALCSLPKHILSASGRFLYSDISTLRPGKFYLLGYNPGGDPGKILTSLQDEIREWGTEKTNAYLDEIWRHSPQAGGSPYQRNVQELTAMCRKNACNPFYSRWNPNNAFSSLNRKAAAGQRSSSHCEIYEKKA